MDGTNAAESPQGEGGFGEYTPQVWMDDLECILAPGASIDERWPLHSAAAAGRADVVRDMLVRGYDKDEVDDKGCSALQGAATMGHVGATEALLAAGASVSLRCHGDMSPLDRAAGGGRVDTAKMIIERGADVNAAGTNGATPLHRAATFGKADVIQLLCLNGADVDKIDARGQTPLQMAVIGNRAAAKATPSAAGAVTSSPSDQDDMSALVQAQASSRGHADVMATLVEHGANANGVWRGGITALHFAIAMGKVDMVRLLCLKGAEVDKMDDKRFTPLFLAVVAKNMAIVQALLAAGADSSIRCGEFSLSVLDASVGAGYVDFARVLLEHGADANAARADGSTPLHHAVAAEDPEIVSLLCLKGANVDTLNGCGYTPLQLTAAYGKAAAARTLLAAGADATNRHDVDKMSVLARAAMNGGIDLMMAIIEHGVDVNARSDRGVTALHVAAGFDRTAAIDALLGAGADIEARVSSNLNTPLIFAAIRGNVSAVVALLKHDACVSKRNDAHRSALHYAAENAGKLGTAQVVDLLLRHGADEKGIDRGGRTPADVVGRKIDEQDGVAGDVERVRRLLANAPADRAWRRRAFLVLCRAFYAAGRVQLGQGSSHVSASMAKRTRSDAEPPRADFDWAGVASMLMGVGADPISLMGDGADIIFETIVRFV